MKPNTVFFGVLLAPLLGVLIYLWSIGQFGTMAQAEFGSMLGFVLLCWIVAMIITMIIGFPLGFGAAHILRKTHRESLLAYILFGGGLAAGLTFLVGDPAVGVGFIITAIVLAFTYWFGVAKDRVENGTD